ncbi:MAG TPA: hypothetical protein PKV96_01080 [Candidatus Saccharimonas sp.]|nr:hypothetical protein [Candidatus Saccharimonas sp.]
MQHIGLLSFTLLLMGLAFTAIKLPGGLGKTFSQRVAGNRAAEVSYSLLFIVALPLLYVFFALWFVPTYSLPSIFRVFAAVSVVFQVVCTWVPERGGTMTIIHRILTGISGVALLPMVVIIANTQAIPTGLRYVAGVAFAAMLVLLGIALVKQKGFRYALLLQIGYYALFFGVVLSITYT